MSTFIRSALVEIVFLTGVSALTMAAPNGDYDNIRSEEVRPAGPPADFWGQLKSRLICTFNPRCRK